MLTASSATAQLRGHGGPVRALAVSSDGERALSGSFDSTAILWSLQNDAADRVLRFHDGAVNAVAMLGRDRIATAGEDRRIAIWSVGADQPSSVLEGHEGPIAALAVSADGAWLASASWDHTVRVWPLRSGDARVLVGHQDNVNGVAFLPDGRVVSAGYDATLRIWPAGGGPPLVVSLPSPLNSVVVAPDGEIATAGADGTVYFLEPTGERRAEVVAQSSPIVALAISHDGNCLMVNRNAGAGTRILIDRLLGGARPPGYANQPRSHNAVAAAVAQNRADWGIAIESVARMYRLGFLPIAPEHYDFLIAHSRRERGAVQAFLAALRDPDVRASIAALGMRPSDDSA